MIVDVHTHIFPEVRGQVAAGPTRGLGYGRVALGDRTIQLMPPLCEETQHTPGMLIAHLDWAGVDRAVVLQGPLYGECNDYVRRAVRRYPDRLIGAAYVDPWAPGGQAAFEATCSHREFAAVKLEMSQPTGLCGLHPNASLEDPALAWLWQEMERRELVLVLDLGAIGSVSYQTGAVRSLAARHPRLRIVISHLAQPTPQAAADPALRALWEEQIALGRLPNVWFDMASLPAHMAQEGCPYPTAERFLKAAIAEIGAAKILWGTDMPGLLTHAAYPQLLRLAERHLQFLPPADRALILGANAECLFRRA